MLGEDAHQVRPLVEGVTLERAEADVAVTQAGQHSRARRAGLVVALQGLAGLAQRKCPAGGRAQGLEHISAASTSRPALQGQATVAEAGMGRLAQALGAEVQQAIGPRLA